MIKKTMNFNRSLRSSLTKVAFSRNEVVVGRARQVRLVVNPEIRAVIRELSRRQKANMPTIIWLAIHRLWHDLGYSPKEFRDVVEFNLE